MQTTYTAKELGATKLSNYQGCWFTAAGGNGYRLYIGTFDAMQFAGHHSTWRGMCEDARELKGK